MVDVNRHVERLLVSGTINATATLASDTWNVSNGQMFNVALESIAGTAPEIDIVLRIWTGLNGTGKYYDITIASAVSSAPATPYSELDTDNYLFKSAQLRLTGTASNDTDTVVTCALMKY